MTASRAAPHCKMVSNYPEAVELVSRLHDQFGFDTVDNSPLSGPWLSCPGQPAWKAQRCQTAARLKDNLARAQRVTQAWALSPVGTITSMTFTKEHL